MGMQIRVNTTLDEHGGAGGGGVAILMTLSAISVGGDTSTSL